MASSLSVRHPKRLTPTTIHGVPVIYCILINSPKSLTLDIWCACLANCGHTSSLNRGSSAMMMNTFYSPWRTEASDDVYNLSACMPVLCSESTRVTVRLGQWHAAVLPRQHLTEPLTSVKCHSMFNTRYMSRCQVRGAGAAGSIPPLPRVKGTKPWLSSCMKPMASRCLM